MSLISLLQEFDGKEIGEQENGEPIIGRLLPGLMMDDLQELQAMIPCAIPSHIQEILALTCGIEPALECMDFSGLSIKDSIDVRHIFPHALPIAGDGAGNFWVVDLEPRSKDWGPIFYVCHDPPVVAWQAKNLEEFVAQLIAFASFEEGSPINLVHDQYALQIWRDHPNTIKPTTEIHPGDPDLGLFVQSLRKGYLFIDLRRPRIGEGFAWGRFGPKTEVKRYGFHRLFAYRKPPNLIQKLFGY